MRKVLIAGFLLMSYCAVVDGAILPDTIVTVSGTVVSEDGNEPVQAVIEYKQLPYGSIVGKISSNENGEYTIYLHSNANYSFKVSAQGYFAYMEELNVNASDNITRDVTLTGGDVGYVYTLENLIFEVGKTEISASSFGELDILVQRLNEYPNMEIRLEGHTDVQGNADANMKLSEDRVRAVKNYLTNKGTNPERIKTRAYGGTQPLTTDDTPEAHSRNRRVEVRILKVE